MVGTTAGPLNAALNEADAPTVVAGSGAADLCLTEADGLRADEVAGRAGALTGPGDLAETDAGSGEGAGGVGEEEALSAAMDARGGKHRRIRCSST